MQIAEWLENEILADNFLAEDKVPSQYQLAELFTINPATAGKGLTLLVEDEILYKKRGLGMFVTTQAKVIIMNKRKNETLQPLARQLVEESRRLGLSNEALLLLIKNIQGGELT